MLSSFFAINRQNLMKQLRGGLVVITGYNALQWAGDTAVPFRQEANFWYLSGIKEPDWWIIIEGVHATTWLVQSVRTDQQRLFDGSLPPSIAKKISAAHEVISPAVAEDLLRQLAHKHPLAYTIQPPKHYHKLGFTLNPALASLEQKLQRIFANVQDCSADVAKLRAIKQAVEIAAIKKAVAITRCGYDDIYDNLSTFKYEYEIEAEFLRCLRNAGADGGAYEPIVASQKNACTLHYNKNNQKLVLNAPVLLDVAAKYHYYCADVSRTYGLGSLSPRVKSIHQAILDAHQTIIRLLKPGLSLHDLQEKSDDIMKRVIKDTGLTKSLSDPSWRRYFPHAIGHGVGIEPHDPLGFQELKAGMVLTIEPGVYIPKERIGIRIEDTILLSKNGCTNLSKGIRQHI